MKPLLTTAAVLVAAATIAGQSTPAEQTTAPPPSPQPPFRAGVELVRLDVRVTAADGRPIHDIKPQEIRVEEDGEERPIVFFQHIDEPKESYADLASHTVAGEVSTNQGAPRGHLYVLVFDQQHITTGNEQRAREAAQRFLTRRFRPGDRVAAYTLPGPGPQINFTATAQRVAAELIKVRGLMAPVSMRPPGGIRLDEAYQIWRGNEQVIRRVSERLEAERGSDTRPDATASPTAPTALIVKEDSQNIVRTADADTRRVLTMLIDILRPMREIEGRKSVILISEGFYDDNVRRELEDVAAIAAQSYSVIHAIDLNRRGADLTLNEPIGGEQATGVLDRINPLAGLAGETDGLFANDASVRADEVFDTIAAQSQDYYLVGFIPRDAATKNPGVYRRVKVGVTRGGARANTRSGYSLVDPATRLDRRQAIDRALAAPFPLQGLPVRYTTYVLRSPAQGMQRVILSLGAELPLASERLSGSADIVFLVRSASDGRVVASGTDTIALPQRSDPGNTTGTGTFRVQFELPAGEYIMRAIVREPGGLIGSTDRRFTVRALDGPSLAVGDVILSTVPGELPVRPVAYAGDGLSGVFELYGRTADQLLDADVKVEMVTAGAETSVTSGAVELLDIRAAAGGFAREARLALPLTGVAPGTYLVRAKVTVGTDSAAQSVRELEVRPGRQPISRESPPPNVFDPRAVVNGALAARWADEWRGASSSPVSAGALRGLERFAASDFPAAIAAFQRSLADAKSKRDEAAVAFLLGWAFHGAGSHRDAITSWRRAAFVDPTIVAVHLALADVYLQLSQPALAAQALRAGLSALPGSPELLDRLSRLEGR